MKIIRSKKITVKKSLLIGFCLLIILAVGVLVHVYIYKGSLFGWPKNTQTESSINYDPPTQEQRDEGEVAKESFVDKYYPTTDNKSSSTTNDMPSAQETSMTISSTSQTSETIQIRTTIQSTSSGTCKLIMTKDSQDTIVREVETQNLGSYSTCKGFDIPLSDAAIGIWNISIAYSSPTATGNVNQSIEVKQ